MWFKQKNNGSRNTEQANIILESISDGVIMVNKENIIQAFNKGAEHITGWAAKDAVSLDVHSVLQFVDEKGTLYDVGKNPFDKVISANSEVKDSKAYIKTQSGKVISLAIIVTPVLKDGLFNGSVAVFRDVSEERQEEKQRAEFISTASHEMRTPVAAIEGYLALALNNKVAQVDEKARDYLEKAHASTQHLGKLFQDLLLAAKSEDGRLTNHPKVIEMSAFITELSGELRFSAEKKGLNVDLLLNGDGSGSNSKQKVISPLYYTFVDPDRIREAMTNLFDNAVKYTESGTISLGISGDRENVELFVKDTGQGIPSEDIPHLFQKFYRVDNSATRTIGGTGLGLFICRKIAELYDGKIWVESTVGKGSTFIIRIPRLSKEKAESIKLSEASVGPAAPVNDDITAESQA
jgi:PAS domain S-box-containing protein